jgi:hypothetical protein
MKSIFIADVKNCPTYLVIHTIESIEELGCTWTWTKDGNIKYWFK